MIASENCLFYLFTGSKSLRKTVPEIIMASQTLKFDEAFPSLTMSPTSESSWFEARNFTFYDGEKIMLGRTDGLEEIGDEVLPNNSNGIFTEKVVSRKHASIFFRAGRFFVQDENSSHGTMVNGERIQKGSSYKLSDGDILSLGRSGTYKGVEFKAIIGKLSLGFPAYDSVVPNSLDQLPMVEEEEGKEAKPLDRTLSLESLIKVIEEEKNKTPRTERRLAGLKKALQLQEASNLSTQEAVSLVSDLGLSPPNSPGRSLSH